MRKWGILITVFYTIILLFLLDPIIVSLIDPLLTVKWGSLQWWYDESFWPMYVWVALLIIGQALLLFVSVDTSFRRMRRRRHIAVAATTIAIATFLLASVTIWSIIVAIGGDDMFDRETFVVLAMLAPVLIFWTCWGIVFRRYKLGDSINIERLVGWFIKGSVLELLIVVPCHVIVRQREDCSAPFVTGYGIATGIAVMLLAFGPSVLFLYQKRLAEYENDNNQQA